MDIVALCGGIGGAKLALGLYHELDSHELSIICNTGDDIDLFGLHVSPDVDIVMYTLANLVDIDKGWGIKNDSFAFLDMLSTYYQQSDWFSLGDRDLATHVLRTHLLQKGQRLTEITHQLASYVGLDDVLLLPMTDDRVSTHIRIEDDSLIHFEEYFVKHRCQKEIKETVYVGAEKSGTSPEIVKQLSKADAIIICPSNPIASIGPILSIQELKNVLLKLNCPRIGISPLVGGKAIKGPSVKFMKSVGLQPSAYGVARYYEQLLTHFIIDTQDSQYISDIEDLGIEVYVTNTIMKTLHDKKTLARETLSIL